MISQHLELAGWEFDNNDATFGILEIEAGQVVGKNYQDLSKFLKKQYSKLILVNHPDKGGDKNRFDQIHKAYQELKKYIEPLESGNPCVKVSVDAESDGRLTVREFHYGKKLFEKLKIGEEAIGKDFKELLPILQSKDSSFAEDLKKYSRLMDQIHKISQDSSLSDRNKLIKNMELTNELSEYMAKPGMQLFNYITPLEDKRSLIGEDKKALALKFIERLFIPKNILMLSILPLAILTTVTIGCYLSWWIIAFNIITDKVFGSLVNNYMEKYKNSDISTDEFISKISYIQLGSKLLLNYPLAAFSVYLLATNFIANGLTIGGIILGSLLTLAILTEILAPIFSKGCEIYTEKHTKNLLEEDPRDRIQKETDLLKWYDLRKLLMPIIMPLAKKCFAEVASELAERNLDEVSTNMSDVNTESPKSQATEFTQQTVGGIV